MAKNLLLQICEVYEIPHTRWFTNKTFEEHPDKDSIFGLAQMLEGYGVATRVVSYSDKAAALRTLHTPVVAQVQDEWVVVRTITPDEVVYIHHEKPVRTSYDAFLDIWTNAMMLVAPNDDAAEPDLSDHRRTARRNRIKAILRFLIPKCLKK